jgi:phosphate-selective porin OprO and OprP
MTPRTSIGAAGLVEIVLLAWVSPAAAQTAPVTEHVTPAQTITHNQKRELKKGEQEKTDGEREKDRVKEQDPPATFRFAWKDHPSFEIGKRTHIDFRARVQSDALGSDSPSGEADESSPDLARRRIGVGGDIEHLVEFQVERELGDDEPWRDVYANYHQFDAVQVQGGKFKLPFSLDENTSVTNLDFVYRSLAANQLAPGRDRGVMVHGRLFRRVLRYEVGAFDHDGRNGRTRNAARVFGEQTVAGRLTVQPFRSLKSEAADLQIGVAFTTSDVPLGFSSLRGQTFFSASFFDPDFWVQGQRRRTGLEVRWRPGPFSVKSEYIRVTTERRGQSVEDTDLSSLLATGWYVSGTWAITGEKKADGLNRPRRPLFQGGYGAVEVAGRLEKLTFRSAATGEVPSTSVRADVIVGNADRAVTFGVNWYLNRWVKLQFNAIRESLTDPSQGPRLFNAGFWSHVVRFQFAL